jgi:hypothetical protein
LSATGSDARLAAMSLNDVSTVFAIGTSAVTTLISVDTWRRQRRTGHTGVPAPAGGGASPSYSPSDYGSDRAAPAPGAPMPAPGGPTPRSSAPMPTGTGTSAARSAGGRTPVIVGIVTLLVEIVAGVMAATMDLKLTGQDEGTGFVVGGIAGWALVAAVVAWLYTVADLLWRKRKPRGAMQLSLWLNTVAIVAAMVVAGRWG